MVQKHNVLHDDCYTFMSLITSQASYDPFRQYHYDLVKQLLLAKKFACIFMISVTVYYVKSQIKFTFQFKVNACDVTCQCATHFRSYCKYTVGTSYNMSTHNFITSCSVRTVATVKRYDVSNRCAVAGDCTPLECYH